jgi:hypothetical protein
MEIYVIHFCCIQVFFFHINNPNYFVLHTLVDLIKHVGCNVLFIRYLSNEFVIDGYDGSVVLKINGFVKIPFFINGDVMCIM